MSVVLPCLCIAPSGDSAFEALIRAAVTLTDGAGGAVAGARCAVCDSIASQIGTGDTIALSSCDAPTVPGAMPAHILIVREQTAPRWHALLAEQVRAAAIRIAPDARVNALVLGSPSAWPDAPSLARCISYLASANAVTGQVLALAAD